MKKSTPWCSVFTAFVFFFVPYQSRAQNSIVITHDTIVLDRYTLTVPGNLRIETGTLAINTGILTSNGAIEGGGMLSGSKDAMLCIGGNAGTCLFTPTSNHLKTLTIFSTGILTIGNTLNIVGGSNPGIVCVDGILDANGFLTLKSDSLGTARVAPSTGEIRRDVTVERYINPRRAWRLLTVPFAASTQSINAAWQEGYTNTSLVCPSQYPATAGYGTHITYNGTNGYDQNTTQNPSITVLTGSIWSPPSSTMTTRITDYDAYFLFVRGDRTICLSQGVNAVPNETVLRAKGVLHPTSGVTKSFSVSPGEFIAVGNPYASPIDIEGVLARSIGINTHTFWLFDPNLAIVGGYITYASAIVVPLSQKYPSAARTRIIESGQGFFVQAVAPTQTIVFVEADKVAL